MIARKPKMIAARPIASRLPSCSTSMLPIGSSSARQERRKVGPWKLHDGDQPVGHDLRDPLGIDGGDVHLVHGAHARTSTYGLCVADLAPCIVGVARPPPDARVACGGEMDKRQHIVVVEDEAAQRQLLFDYL